MQREQIKQIFNNFSSLKIMVIGDVMLDDYVIGSVNRISPEAPVPVVDIEKRYARLGGAANVALNLKSLGAEPILCSVIGKGNKNDVFLQNMQQANLNTIGIIQSSHRKLTIKHRILGNNVQLLRMDDEQKDFLTEEDNNSLMSKIKHIVDNENIDAILFEDYDKGVISPELINSVVVLATSKKIPITVDPKKRNFSNYHHIDIFKPNLKELKEGIGNLDLQIENDDDISEIINFMIEKQHKIMLLTLSEKGVLIIYNTKNGYITERIPAHLRKISDVSGAGDTVLSVATLCLILNLLPNEIAQLSNLAGGIVCEYAGVVAIDKDIFFQEAINLL